jgi:branched-subunit amino acid ABC-type transport system permease component
MASFSAAIGTTPVKIGSVSLLRVEVWGFVVTVVLVVALFALLRFTPIGLALRAVADQPQAARLSGIPTPLVRMLSWSLGSGLAAVAGFFIAAHFVLVYPTFMEAYLIAALIAVVIGGLGSLPGAALGAVLLSVAQFVFVGYAPTVNIGDHPVELSAFTNTFLFLVLIAVLVVAPRGLLGGARVRRV